MDIELTPIAVIGSLCATIVLISYYRIRRTERLALIAAGRDAGTFKEEDKKPRLHASLKYGLLMIGLALGLLVGEVLVKTTSINVQVAYFSMVLIFGGLSLLFFYNFQRLLEKKQP